MNDLVVNVISTPLVVNGVVLELGYGRITGWACVQAEFVGRRLLEEPEICICFFIFVG